MLLGILGLGLVGVVCAGPKSPFKIAYDEATTPLLPLVSEVYQELGIQVEFVLLPSERGVVGADRGVYDADISRVEGTLDAYPQLMHTKEPLKVTQLLPFVIKGSALRVKGLADLRRYKVGILRGSKFSERYVRDAQLAAELAPNSTSLLKMLEWGRFDIALMTSSQISAQPESIYALVEPAGAALASSRSFHVLNKRHADLAPKFDAALKAFKADGRWARLLPLTP